MIGLNIGLLNVDDELKLFLCHCRRRRGGNGEGTSMYDVRPHSREITEKQTKKSGHNADKGWRGLKTQIKSWTSYMTAPKTMAPSENNAALYSKWGRGAHIGLIEILRGADQYLRNQPDGFLRWVTLTQHSFVPPLCRPVWYPT